jgi:glutamine synthetase
MAAPCVAARYGLSLDKKTALDLAAEKYVDLDIHKKEGAEVLARLDALPASCAASADCLEKVRTVYEEAGVFSPRMIDGVLQALRSFGDADLHARADADPTLMKEYVDKFFYCG